jgi:hypothetical protein
MILMFLWLESGARMRIIPPHLALFRHSKVAGAGMELKGLRCHIAEWKGSHTYVQRFLLLVA